MPISALPAGRLASGVPARRARTVTRAASPEVTPATADANVWRAGAKRERRAENAAGTFWVDSACIDCDTCRRLAPSVFARKHGQSAVVAQPASDADTAALAALLSCPTFSIHADPRPDKAGLAAAAACFPGPVPGVTPPEAGGPPVLYNGHTAGAAFGASSYLLLRGGGKGNILIDSPRFDKGLAANILARGPVDYMFLTHRDDVADHAKWAAALGCDRIIHAGEVNPEQGTDGCEVKLEGAGPWRLPDGGEDVEVFLQAGHTEWSIMLHHVPSRSLFAGDVLAFAGGGPGPVGDDFAYSEAWLPARGPGDPLPPLAVHRAYTWYSIPALLTSLEGSTPGGSVVGRDWLHLFPGHGRMGSFPDGGTRDAALAELITRERAADAAGAPAKSPFFG